MHIFDLSPSAAEQSANKQLVLYLFCGSWFSKMVNWGLKLLQNSDLYDMYIWSMAQIVVIQRN